MFYETHPPMNESTYRKYGSTKNQRLFINANAVTTDVLQFVRRLEGDYEVNGSFRVTNNLTANRNLKLLNTDATLQSDAEILTSKGRMFIDASRHLQLSETTNLFSPNAIHFTNHDSYVSNRGTNRVISLLARRDKSSVQTTKDGLLLSDDRIQISAADQYTTTNQGLNNYPHSSSSSYESSFSIETQNRFSQLHCLYTGTDFQGKSVLADAKNATVRLSAKVESANVASLLLEPHDGGSVVGGLKFFTNTRTPELPDIVDSFAKVVLPASATRHVAPQFTNSSTETSSFTFGSGPIVAAFNGSNTHATVPESFPSLFARNRLEVVSSKNVVPLSVDPTLHLLGGAEEESQLDLVAQLLNPRLPKHPFSAASLQVRTSANYTTNQAEFTRFPDFHAPVKDGCSYPASWTVSPDGQKLLVGKGARTAYNSTRNPFGVLESAGTSSFSRPGARAHLQNSLSPASFPSLKNFAIPSSFLSSSFEALPNNY